MTTEVFFLAFIPYLALVTRVWMGANMMIHGYPKMKNMKQTAEETGILMNFDLDSN
jgi:hypothetical protein